MQDSQRKGGRKYLNLASFDRGSSTIERNCVMGANASHDGRISGSSVERRLHTVLRKGSYLVDPASSHMLVSKIKPCMSKYKRSYTAKLRMAH